MDEKPKMRERKLRSDIDLRRGVAAKMREGKAERNVVVWGIFKDFTRPLTTLPQAYTTRRDVDVTPRHDGIKGSRDIAPLMLNLWSRWFEWSTALPDRFIPAKEPGSHWTWGSLGPGAGPEVLENKKIFVSTTIRTTNHPPLPSHHTAYAIPRYFYTVYIFDNNVRLELAAPGTRNHNPQDLANAL